MNMKIDEILQDKNPIASVIIHDINWLLYEVVA